MALEVRRWRGVTVFIGDGFTFLGDGRPTAHVAIDHDGDGFMRFGVGFVVPDPAGWRASVYAQDGHDGPWTLRLDAGAHRTRLAAVLAILRANARTAPTFASVRQEGE
jgi:hypothetical protein